MIIVNARELMRWKTQTEKLYSFHKDYEIYSYGNYVWLRMILVLLQLRIYEVNSLSKRFFIDPPTTAVHRAWVSTGAKGAWHPLNFWTVMSGTHWFWQIYNIMLCCTLDFLGFTNDWHPLFQISNSSPGLWGLVYVNDRDLESRLSEGKTEQKFELPQKWISKILSVKY